MHHSAFLFDFWKWMFWQILIHFHTILPPSYKDSIFFFFIFLVLHKRFLMSNVIQTNVVVCRSLRQHVFLFEIALYLRKSTAAAGVSLNLLYYIEAISKTRWLNFAIGPAVVLMVMHGFSLTCCQGSHISMPFRTCILAWNNTYCIISRWTSSGNTPQLSWKAFCICQPSTSHNYLAVGTQRVMGSRLMDTQAFWFLIVIVILSTWGLGNASFEPPLSTHIHTTSLHPSTPTSSSSCGGDVEYSTAAHFSPACSIKRCNPTEM